MRSLSWFVSAYNVWLSVCEAHKERERAHVHMRMVGREYIGSEKPKWKTAACPVRFVRSNQIDAWFGPIKQTKHNRRPRTKKQNTHCKQINGRTDRQTDSIIIKSKNQSHSSENTVMHLVCFCFVIRTTKTRIWFWYCAWFVYLFLSNKNILNFKRKLLVFVLFSIR